MAKNKDFFLCSCAVEVDNGDLPHDVQILVADRKSKGVLYHKNVDEALEFIFHKLCQQLKIRWKKGLPGIMVTKKNEIVSVDLPVKLLSEKEKQEWALQEYVPLDPTESKWLSEKEIQEYESPEDALKSTTKEEEEL